MDDEKQEITIDLHTALEMENDIIEERAPEIEKNQKLGLLLGFLSVHDWYIPCMLLILDVVLSYCKVSFNNISLLYSAGTFRLCSKHVCFL